MEQLIDLDAAAASLDRRLPRWRSSGLTVGPLTWADGQTTIHQIHTDRAAVRGDYSVGVRLSRGDEGGEFILYAGGWADFIYWSGRPDEAAVQETPGWDAPLDLARCEAVFDRMERLFALMR